LSVSVFDDISGQSFVFVSMTIEPGFIDRLEFDGGRKPPLSRALILSVKG
jgi:hypothetical protein